MANERLILAIGQMERALARLETVQRRIDHAGSTTTLGIDSELADRHAKLKAAAAEALAGMDAFMAKLG